MKHRRRRALLSALIGIVSVWAWALSSCCLNSETPFGGAEVSAEPTPLDGFMNALIKDEEIASVSVGLIKDRKLVLTAAWGVADRTTKRAAKPDTIYAMASCSKPVVGLAAAKLVELRGEKILDEDINTFLKWPRRVEHPDYPDVPITLRHLMLHKSGLVADAPFDYDTYPKPDPDQALDAFMRGQVLDEERWLDHAPGKKFAYSNLGTALAALVIEKAAGKDFRAFCDEHLFKPMGLKDTRWFFKDFDAAQQARVARPHDEDGVAYKHYSFNDYPSGSLRTTTTDFAALWIMVMNKGTHDGKVILKPESVERFKTVPMFIEREAEEGPLTFGHDGGEAGVVTSFRFREDGTGFVYMINSDIDDEDRLEKIQGRIEAKLIEALKSR